MIANHLSSPQVTKKQVDNFRERKLTPCCQLKAEVSQKRENIPTLKHRVSLTGARYPNNAFTLDLPTECKLNEWHVQVCQ